MIRLVEVDSNDEGLVGLIGKKVTLMCSNYFYSGELVGVNTDFVKLRNAAIVYETGSWGTKEYSDEQSLPNKDAFYVRIPFIESFGELK